jgi:hypothetical protein
LSALRERTDPSGAIHRGSEVVAVALVRLSGVDRDPHPQRDVVAPTFGLERAIEIDRGCDGVGRAAEDRKRCVALAFGLDQVPAAFCDDACDQPVVPFQDVRHRGGMRLPQLRGTFDVAEQERHDARRKPPIRTRCRPQCQLG